MGHIWMTSEAFVASLSEDAGTRSGFALGEHDILHHLSDEHIFIESITAREMVRLASNDYADAVGDLLFSLGTTDTEGMPSLGQRLLPEMDSAQRKRLDVMRFLELEAVAIELCRRKARNAPNQSELINELRELLSKGLPVKLESVLREVEFEVAMNPFMVGNIEKQGLLELNNLFESEILPLEEDRFFDQRFIDYLARNPNRIQDIQWRQFEGLTAEWFQRAGYEVKLGPGRKDGGVDIRLWKEDVSKSGPPTIIVQCKRYKEKVDAVTVKALYSDVQFENAKGGLIVTTSDITRGTKITIDARNYPITSVNQCTVRDWIQEMKSPGNGFLKFDD